jgi:hypothetical protein
MATYEIWLADDEGNRLENLNQFTNLEYVIAIGETGWFNLELPYDADLLAMDSTKPDRQIHIMRAPDGGSLALEQAYFIERWAFPTSNGLTTCKLAGSGLNKLLDRRIVGYYAGSSQASMTGVEADDMMKRIVDDALGSDANTDYDGNPVTGRDIEALGFSIEAEATLAPQISRAFSWQNLLSTLQGIQAQTKAEGDETFFNIVATGTSPLTCEFRTYINQPGDDRTGGQPNALRFGTEWGNVDNPTLTVDYADLKNFVYIGGSGQESARAIEEVSDAASIALSQFGRRETFATDTSTDVTAVLQSAGYTRLTQNKVKTTFTAEIQDTPDAPYGGANGWNAGDKITISYIGRQIDAIVRRVRVYIGVDGEQVFGSIEV